jgi:hypothetical protein
MVTAASPKRAKPGPGEFTVTGPSLYVFAIIICFLKSFILGYDEK